MSADPAALARQLEEARLVAAIEEKLARKRLLEEQLAWEAERDAERAQIASQLDRLEALRFKVDEEIEERTAAAEESLQQRTIEFVAYRDQTLAQLKAAEDALRLSQTQLALERRALEVDKAAILRDRKKLDNDQEDFKRERQDWLDAVSRRIPAMLPRGSTPDIFALAEWNDSAAGAVKEEIALLREAKDTLEQEVVLLMEYKAADLGSQAWPSVGQGSGPQRGGSAIGSGTMTLQSLVGRGFGSAGMEPPSVAQHQPSPDISSQSARKVGAGAFPPAKSDWLQYGIGSRAAPPVIHVRQRSGSVDTGTRSLRSLHGDGSVHIAASASVDHVEDHIGPDDSVSQAGVEEYRRGRRLERVARTAKAAARGVRSWSPHDATQVRLRSQSPTAELARARHASSGSGLGMDKLMATIRGCQSTVDMLNCCDLSGVPGVRIERSHVLVCHGAMDKLTRSGINTFYFWLLSTQILYGYLSPHEGVCNITRVIPLAGCTVQDGSDVISDESLQNLSFEIRTPLGDVVLIADSIEVKTAWLSDLQLCINEANG